MIARSFYFLRHGETDWNVVGRMQGHSDIPLNDKGRAQAAAALEILKTHPIDRIVTSTLSRAFETAEIVNAHLKKPIDRDPMLREKHFGLHEGRNVPEIEAWERENPHLVLAIEPETGFAAPPEGENYAQFSGRIMTGFTAWLDKHPNENILFVTHGAIYRVLHRHFFGVGEYSPNAKPFHFVRENDTLWTLKAL